MRAFFFLVKWCFLLGLVGSIALAIYSWDYFEGPGPLVGQKTILLKRGLSFQGIVEELTQQGVIDRPLLFKGIAAGLGQGRNFKAGEYNFPAGVTPKTVMRVVAQGKVVIHKITIAEGLTVRDIAKLLQAEPTLEGDIPAGLKEGTLLPETYQFIHGDKREDIIRKMQADMRTLVDTLWAKRQAGLPYDTLEKAMILASIVEKETGVPNERGHVASVFVNRMRKGMRLQSDPTVAYGVEKALGNPLGRPLTIEDLRTPTPYNTYMIDGLPPEPIANPGRASIEATMNPPDSNDLYFVATGTGGHNFAPTLEEHNRNVAAYRRKMEAAK